MPLLSQLANNFLHLPNTLFLSLIKMDSSLKTQFQEIVGASNVIDDPTLYGPYTDDFTDHYKSVPLAVIRPASAEEVSRLVKLCAEKAIPIIAQGGNTNLTGSASTTEPGKEILISMTRMKKLLSADPASDTMTVQAGMTLEEVHEKAESINRFFPLSFAAEGNATIGGCCACNAGGVAVLRYGTTRELVLGLEVVLPDGRIFNGLRRLRKDNTGYDFKDLFIGSEGTLGIITAVVLKLYPIPQQKETAFVSLDNPKKANELLNRAKLIAGSSLSAFELISELPIGRVAKYLPDVEVPKLTASPWKVLIELSFEHPTKDSVLEKLLESAFENDEILDAVIAQSVGDAKTFWHVRESIPLADRTAGGSIHSDISLPISSIPQFIEETSAKLKEAFPWLGLSIYGHLGDGNLHFNFVSPQDPKLTYQFENQIRDILYGEVNKFEGSISAEHGIGMLKLEHNYQFKEPLEIELMRKIKQAIDPKSIMNPGKLLRQ